VIGGRRPGATAPRAGPPTPGAERPTDWLRPGGQAGAVRRTVVGGGAGGHPDVLAEHIDASQTPWPLRRAQRVCEERGGVARAE